MLLLCHDLAVLFRCAAGSLKDLDERRGMCAFNESDETIAIVEDIITLPNAEAKRISSAQADVASKSGPVEKYLS